MSLLDRVRACHSWDPAAYRPLVIAEAEGRERVYGRVPHALARRLADFAGVFEVGAEAIRFAPPLARATPEARSEAVADLLARLVEGGDLPRLRGETYPVVRTWGEPPRFLIDRGAVAPLGIRSFGVHLNGYVGEGEGLQLWAGKRAADKAVAPGKLDNMVAGGQPHGLGLAENLEKESGEEAGIPPALARRARPAGLIAYRSKQEDGLRDDVLFCFDLAVPADFTPVCVDGELQWLKTFPIGEVLQRIADSEDFKFNVALVIIDFAIRHGVLGPDRLSDYQRICELLRKRS